MLRFIFPIVTIATIMTMGACSGRDPVSDEANNMATPSDVDVLPPDESVATPTNDLENGADEELNQVNTAEGGAATIPASFHGRWAMTPADCQRQVAGGEGGVLVTGNELRFHQSVARPLRDVRITGTAVTGHFAFTGEGTRRTRHETLEIRDNKLVRTESDPMASFTYARCTA